LRHGIKRWGCYVLAGVLWATPGFARQDPEICGTYPERWKQTLAFHRHVLRSRAVRPLAAPSADAISQDAGNIAVLEDSDGVVARQNDFNLDGATLTFLPSAARAAKYRFQTAAASYDMAAAASGTPLSLHDDDSQAVTMPFAFPFFGASYRQVFVNSDGNLTFVSGDSASTARSLGRMNAGPPRISPLFEDLNPDLSSQGVRVLAESGRLVVSWVQVPEYQASGLGLKETFQARLYPDGRIEFAYAGVTTSGAVVGIAPGNLRGSSTLVSFFGGSTSEYGAAVEERFGSTVELDVALAAQRFYQTHDDAYDYLVFYNNEGVAAGDSAVSWESTVRNNRSGYGDVPIDIGQEFGSAGRLQAVLNMGPLNQYPPDPNGTVAARATSGDTPVTVLAHEAGHLFLAYASIPDENDPAARPMLGYQNSHWNFAFNSEASLLEGNRIQDKGTAVSPRFLTTDAVEWYSPLDQYLMGFRAPGEVEPAHQMFLVTGVPASFKSRHPQVGVGFDGKRLDIHLAELIQAVGRRTPDSTVAQRHFRFAFILVVHEGSQPSAADLAQVEAYRAKFEAFYQQAASNRAYADASLRKGLALSVAPAAGVVAGQTATAAVTVQTPPPAALTVNFQTQTGAAGAPAAVTIPAGARSASFQITGLRAGVEEISAIPSDGSYESGYARVQVAPLSALTLAVVSGDQQVSNGNAPLANPVVVRLTDVNQLPYVGVRLTASTGAGGSVSPAAVTDPSGQASFQWTTGTTGAAQLTISVAGGPSVEANALTGVVTAAAAVNAASFAPTISPGSLATLFGGNLAGASVSLGGQAAQVLFSNSQQINFLTPANLPAGPVMLTVTNPRGLTGSLTATVAAVAPGIFFDPATRFGAVLDAGSADTTQARPAGHGDYVEIYGTGLGPTSIASGGNLSQTLVTPQVWIAGIPAEVAFSGLAPGIPGLYQINARIPSTAPSGAQPLVVMVNGVRSNEVQIGVQ